METFKKHLSESIESLQNDLESAKRLGFTKEQMLKNLDDHTHQIKKDLEKAQDGLKRQDDKIYGAYWRKEIIKAKESLVRITALRKLVKSHM